jgi:hypothetical protein
MPLLANSFHVISCVNSFLARFASGQKPQQTTMYDIIPKTTGSMKTNEVRFEEKGPTAYPKMRPNMVTAKMKKYEMGCGNIFTVTVVPSSDRPKRPFTIGIKELR